MNVANCRCDVTPLSHHSITLLAAGAAGFLTLIQSLVRPDRYGLSRRLATMPRAPMPIAPR